MQQNRHYLLTFVLHQVMYGVAYRFVLHQVIYSVIYRFVLHQVMHGIAYRSVLHKVMYSVAYMFVLHKTAQTHLRRIQNGWWRKKANDLQQYAYKHDCRSFYNALKAVYDPKCASVSPVKTADGSQLIIDEEAILSR